ncbi:MAG: hypothetical protein JXL84_11025 [Deltaproteobacteria bacterium]|nr:hypothetical protein [Deltaproteobacteria bacterium]
MSRKQWVPCFLMVPLLALLSGCIYMRLLEIKRQLADFERHCALEYQDALVVVFREPVLLKQDILHLAKHGPTMAEEGRRRNIWQYHFVKQYPPRQEGEKGIFDVPVRLFFDDHRMNMGSLPARFFELLPRDFIIEGIRAIGRSHVNPVTRYGEGRFDGKHERPAIPIPQKQDFLRLLGRPYSIENADKDSTLNFLYSLQRGAADPSPPSAAWARLTFAKGGEELSKIEARFAGMRLVLSLDKPGLHASLIHDRMWRQAAPAHRGNL